MRIFAGLVAACLTVLLVSCGGGGGDDDSVNTAAAPPAQAADVPVAVAPDDSNAANAVPIVVKTGAAQIRNIPLVSVTICSPGSAGAANCATIDNVLLDSGSFGLRLFASAIPAATLATLTPQQSAGAAVAECALFADSNGWGSVRNGDVRMSQELAQNVPINVWQDDSLAADLPAATPAACHLGTPLKTPDDLGANGILGVGVAPADCPGCSRTADPQFYYACRTGTCAPALQPIANQIGNPVSRFAQDNNGLIIQMPKISDAGQQTANGTLVFGIDTQPNNALVNTGATLLATDAGGDFNTVFQGVAMPGFMDSGSNAFFFPDDDLPRAAANSTFYAPVTTTALSIAISAHGGAAAPSTVPPSTVPFNVANADALFANNASAYNNLAGAIPGSFDFGMSFFYGHHVYYGISAKASAGGGTGPYVAFTSQ